MKPKRARDLYKQTAEDLKEPEELVNDLLSFFWSTTYKAMSDITYPAVRIPKLGVFRLRYKDIDREVNRIQAFLEKSRVTWDPNPMRKYAIIKANEERLAKLLEMQEYLRVEMLNQRNFEKAKKDGKLTEYLEEQRKNNGGNKEQSVQEGTRGSNSEGENGSV